MTPYLHIATGQAYLWGVGGLSAALAHRLWRDSKQSALVFVGLVWMALSCGPHHGHWGAHLLSAKPTRLDTLTIAVALPFGAAWLYWQTAAVFSEHAITLQRTGGTIVRPRIRRALTYVADRRPKWWHTDWHIPGDSMLPALALLALVAYCTAIVSTSRVNQWTSDVIVQAVLAGLYLVIGGLWWVGQFERRHTDGEWSAKGCTLGMIWPTCAMNHWSWAVGVGDGVYRADWHMFAIDAVGIPAAASFIGLVTYLRHQAREVA